MGLKIALVGHADVVAELARVESEGGVVSDEVAATIASWWQTSGPHDAELVRLAHTGEVQDWESLREAVEHNLHSVPGERSQRSLTALREWVRAKAGCIQCGTLLRGVLLGANYAEAIEACDECLRYDSDITAAFVVAKLVGGTVCFWQHDAELYEDVERRVREGELEGDYDPAEVGFELRRYDDESQQQDDDCLRYNEYPWIEIEGERVNWRIARRILSAFEKPEARA